MHPWMANQANRERVAELRALGRPFGGSLSTWRVERPSVDRAPHSRTWQGVGARRRRLSVGF